MVLVLSLAGVGNQIATQLPTLLGFILDCPLLGAFLNSLDDPSGSFFLSGRLKATHTHTAGKKESNVIIIHHDLPELVEELKPLEAGNQKISIHVYHSLSLGYKTHGFEPQDSAQARPSRFWAFFVAQIINVWPKFGGKIMAKRHGETQGFNVNGLSMDFLHG